ncbi:oligosaccharide flippase family protein [Alkalicoccus luteus]|uniref:oligosaccharide flippase family protein n=1 Tax=Alkalicoccus luteus TaxID=1237094 RepID=UPI004033F63D
MPHPTPSWAKGAAYLSLAALAAKGLSALYKIPYQNMTGDTGFYVYQQVYPLYGAVLVLGTYGFPLVIAKALIDNGSRDGIRSLLTFYTAIMIVLFGLLGGAVTLAAPWLAALMGDPALTEPLRWMGLPFLLIPFAAAARGYFQHDSNTLPTAVSQVIEQFIRVIVILLAAWAGMQLGSVYTAGASAGIGAFAGGAAGLASLWFYVRREESIRPDFRLPPAWQGLMRELLVKGLFVSASAMLLILFQLIDAFTIVQRLPEGLQTAQEKGVYDRSWPLIQFGAVVITVFSYAALPAVAKAWPLDRRRASEEAGSALKLCTVFGAAAALGMAAVMPLLNVSMFTDASGTAVLQVMALSILPAAVFMTAAALLHAADHAGTAAALLLGALAGKAVLNVLLVPVAGTMGAAAATVLAAVLLAAASVRSLIRIGVLRPGPGTWLVKTGAALLIMTAAAWFAASGPIGSRAGASVQLALVSGGGAVLYIGIIWRLSVFTVREWEMLPKLGTRLPHRRQSEGGNHV